MVDENCRHITISGKTTCASGKNTLLASCANHKKYQITLKQADVAILHPSFLSPLLKETGKNFSLIVLTDKLFHNTYDIAEGKEDKKAGPCLSGAVNRFIKMVKWSDINKSAPATKPMFCSISNAIKNIEVHFLWQLPDLKNHTLTNKDNKPFAQIHPEVIKMYQDKGLIYGFEIVIKNLSNDAEGLYDISWMSYNRAKTEDETGYFYELQDDYINQYNENYRKLYYPLKCSIKEDTAPVFTEQKTQIQSYHPVYISSKPCLNIGQLSDVHVSARQHLFTQSKARLVDGKDNTKYKDKDPRSDKIGPLVNTSYATLKNLMKQMGDDTDLLIFTGDLIDYKRNFNPDNSKNGANKLKKSAYIWEALNLDNLKDKQLYPKGIDNLVLYELFRWYYDTYNKPIMLVSGNHEGYTLPFGISSRVKLFRSIATRFSKGKWVPKKDENGKPIIDDIGMPVLTNRKYTKEEMIDRSIKKAKKDKEASKTKGKPDTYFKRANETVPADHNLTIPEAILMYGADYARVVMPAATDQAGERNYKPDNLVWFYTVFTPLTSYWSSYAKQCFICLGWGTDEIFVGKEQGGLSPIGSFLPRTTKSISDSQLSLLESALNEDKAYNILCSHFIYANYDYSQPISKKGKVNYNNFFVSHSKYDYGTFESNRNTVYKKLIDNKIHYTLSGHSHRSSIYQITGKLNILGRKYIKIIGQASQNKNFNPINGCRLLVAGSGGNIGRQNHDNELLDFGLDYPSGNCITFKGDKEEQISIKTPKLNNVPQAQPRLAVALDFADIFLRDKKDKFFHEFSYNESNDVFNIQVNPKAKIPSNDLFESMSLCLYKRSTPLQITGKVTSKNKGAYVLKLDEDCRRLIKKLSKEKMETFIKIKCKESAEPILSHYNVDSPWTIHITLIPHYKEKIKAYIEDMVDYDESYDPDYDKENIKKIKNSTEKFSIDRHSVFGEVPNFEWYKDSFPHEYK